MAASPALEAVTACRYRRRIGGDVFFYGCVTGQHSRRRQSQWDGPRHSLVLMWKGAVQIFFLIYEEIAGKRFQIEPAAACREASSHPFSRKRAWFCWSPGVWARAIEAGGSQIIHSQKREDQYCQKTARSLKSCRRRFQFALPANGFSNFISRSSR